MSSRGSEQTSLVDELPHETQDNSPNGDISDAEEALDVLQLPDSVSASENSPKPYPELSAQLSKAIPPPRPPPPRISLPIVPKKSHTFGGSLTLTNLIGLSPSGEEAGESPENERRKNSKDFEHEGKVSPVPKKRTMHKSRSDNLEAKGTPTEDNKSDDTSSIHSDRSDASQLTSASKKQSAGVKRFSWVLDKAKTKGKEAKEFYARRRKLHDSKDSDSDTADVTVGEAQTAPSESASVSSSVSFAKSGDSVSFGKSKQKKSSKTDSEARVPTPVLLAKSYMPVGTAPVHQMIAAADSQIEKRLNDDGQLQAGSQTVPSTKRRQSLSSMVTRSMITGQYRWIVGALLLAFTFLYGGFIAGVCWGVYGCVVGFLCLFVRDYRDDAASNALEMERVDMESMTAKAEKAAHGCTVYKGWLNKLRGAYEPSTYHINQTRSVLARLDGATLRLARPDRPVLRHALCDAADADPSLLSQVIYDLTDARVLLRPRHLARRRWWSRKYPICVVLRRGARVTGRRDATLAAASSGSSSSDSDSADSAAGDSDSQLGAIRRRLTVTNGLQMDGISESQSVPASLSDSGRTKRSYSDQKSEATSLPSRKRQRRKCIYLFARASREKERWFHSLREAAGLNSFRQSRGKLQADKTGVDLSDGMDEQFQWTSTVPSAADEWLLYASRDLQFHKYMSELLSVKSEKKTIPAEREVGGIVLMDLSRNEWKYQPTLTSAEKIASLNAIGARIFFDFCRDPKWIKAVQNRIQLKLSTIRLPYFIETLSLSKLEPGRMPPKVTDIHQPTMDQWGLWIDLQTRYSGGLRLQLETKVNLMKLKSDGLSTTSSPVAPPPPSPQTQTQQSRYSDEEMPESPESSADDEAIFPLLAKRQQENSPPRESTSKRLLNLVDKVTKSKYFQQATDIESVRKFMQGVSSTRLMLTVEVSFLEGTMALNFPPPPSDRLWYGFRERPRVALRAVPRVGERSVELSAVSDWIEGRLRSLVEKNLVLPNMDDVVLSCLATNPMLGRHLAA